MQANDVLHREADAIAVQRWRTGLNGLRELEIGVPRCSMCSILSNQILMVGIVQKVRCSSVFLMCSWNTWNTRQAPRVPAQVIDLYDWNTWNTRNTEHCERRRSNV